MPKKEKDVPVVNTYRVGPVGDGRMFGWTMFSPEGEILEESLQTFMSEADAEKNARGFVTGADVIAVSRMTTVDKDDNAHIVYESGAVEDVKKFGATIKYAKPDQERPTSDDQPTPADIAVSEGLVAEVASTDERSEKDQKAVDRSAAKSKADDEKAAKEAEASR